MRLANWIYTVPLKLRSLFKRRQADQELDEELRYHVECKTEEYITKGLAASTRDVLRMVLRKGAFTSIAGISAGVLGALVLTRWLRSQLFEVSATDPPTFATVALLLFLVSLLACWIPARRATRVDPMVALRYE